MDEGIECLFGIDANKLENHFGLETIDIIISVNCYGRGPAHPGLSYGLLQCTGAMLGTTRKEQRRKKRLNHKHPEAQPQMAEDDRFLRSAHKVLKPGGRIIMLLRNNLMYSHCKELKGNAQQVALKTLRAHNLQAAKDPKEQLSTVNRYGSATSAMLRNWASTLGYQINVSLVTPPDIPFRTIDSEYDGPLHGFNVQIEFIKGGTGVHHTLQECDFWGTFAALQKDGFM